MALSFLTNLNLNSNELQNAKIQNLASPPASYGKGTIYFDTTENALKFYNGTAWVKANDVDVSGKADKVSSAINGHLAGLDANGNLTDSGKSASDFLDAHPDISTLSDTTSAATATHGGSFTAVDGVTRDGNGHVTKVNTKTVTLPAATDISGKTDKVASATNGNLAALDSHGNLTDSGEKASSFLKAHPTISTSSDTTSSSTPGAGGSFTAVDGVTRDANGHVTKVNTKTVTIPAAVDISDKADKVSGATSGNLAKLDANGNLVDAGVSASSFIAVTAKGAANGVASLDSNGLVPSSQLPSYVDDVLSYAALSNFPATGEDGKIYIATGTNLTYRWSGTAYVEISKSLGIGTTAATAAAGNRGLPSGGATGQVLKKASGTDYDVSWQNETAHATKYTANNPELTPSGGVATWTVTHGLGTRAVVVQLALASSPYSVVYADVAMATTTTVTISLVASATVGAGTYTVTVIG